MPTSRRIVTACSAIFHHFAVLLHWHLLAKPAKFSFESAHIFNTQNISGVCCLRHICFSSWLTTMWHFMSESLLAEWWQSFRMINHVIDPVSPGVSHQQSPTLALLLNPDKSVAALLGTRNALPRLCCWVRHDDIATGPLSIHRIPCRPPVLFSNQCWGVSVIHVSWYVSWYYDHVNW